MLRDSTIAWIAAATHVVAALGMLVLLRPGLPGFSEEERLAWMQGHRAAWLGGWLLWQLAALSLLAFYATLALRFRGALSIAAMAAAAAGVALDIACESRYMAVLPELAGDAFAALDRDLEVLIGYGANGLYTVALLLLVFAGWKELPTSALALAIPVILAGFALALASLAHSARFETITSAILFPLFTLWIVIVGRWQRSSES